MVLFHEIHTRHLTSNTTCYTGAQNDGADDDVKSKTSSTKSPRLATENHILSIDIDNHLLLRGGFMDDEQWAIPRSNSNGRSSGVDVDKNMICVGYSKRGDLEALALLDPTQVEDQQDNNNEMDLLIGSSDLYPSTLSQTLDGSTSADDTQSVLSATTQSVSTAEHSRQHRRLASSSSFSSGGSGGGTAAPTAPVDTASSAGNTANTATPTKQQGPGTSASASGDTSASTTILPSETSRPKVPSSDLIRLQQVNIDGVGDSVDDSNAANSKARKGKLILKDGKTEKEYFAYLDYRPLCPCVCSVGGIDGGGGIFIGSADDFVLRLYTPQQKEDGGDSRARYRLVQEPSSLFPSEHFTFTTPIVALSYLEIDHDDDFATKSGNNEDNNQEEGVVGEKEDQETSVPLTMNRTRILCIACQDGTLKVMAWKNDSYEDIKSTNVVVDGPLICLQLSLIEHQQSQQSCADDHDEHRKKLPTVRLVAGSLCGYVCEMLYYESKQKWEGPFMAMKESYWNKVLEEEDSILAVSSWDFSPFVYMVMGTQSGRLVLYRKIAASHIKTYSKIWECLLPYAIHGVLMTNGNAGDDEQRTTNCGSKLLQIVVTTRRTVHIFEETGTGYEQRRIHENKVTENKRRPSALKYSVRLAKERLQVLLKNENGIGQEFAGEPVKDAIES